MNFLVWNWSSLINFLSSLWILIAWCLSAVASVATVLRTPPCIPSCLLVYVYANAFYVQSADPLHCHQKMGFGVHTVKSLRPRQNDRRFADDTFKRIFPNENVRISIKISLKFVPKGPINIIPSLVQIMTWRRSGDKPLSEPMMVSLLTHICVTRPQWVLNVAIAWSISAWHTHEKQPVAHMMVRH